MSGDDLLVFVPDGDLQPLVLLRDLHDHDRVLDIFVQRDDLQDGVEQLGHAVAVGAQEDAVVGLCHRDAGEIAVADADPVAVAHLTQDLQQLRGKDWGDIVQHIQYLLFSRPPVDFGRRTI